KFAEIVGEVAVTHDDVLAANRGQRVDIRATKATSRDPQDASAVLLCDLGRAIGGAIDDQYFAAHTGGRQSFAAPVHALAHAQLLIEARDDNRNENVGTGFVNPRFRPVRKSRHRGAGVKCGTGAAHSWHLVSDLNARLSYRRRGNASGFRSLKRQIRVGEPEG